MKTIPSNLYPKVLDLINETYVDKMDSIESAQVDEDGTIEAIAIDEGAKFVCRYQGGAIEIKALEPDKEPKTAGFAAGKARNCKAGISCGGSCTSKTKTCKKKGTSGQAGKAAEIVAAVHPKFTKAAGDSAGRAKGVKGSVTSLDEKRAKKNSNVAKLDDLRDKKSGGTDLGSAARKMLESKKKTDAISAQAKAIREKHEAADKKEAASKKKAKANDTADITEAVKQLRESRAKTSAISAEAKKIRDKYKK